MGVGWLEKEFDVLGVPYAERGPMSDEFLEIFKTLWTDPNPEYHGRFYNVDGIQFYPKPVQQPHLPIWVGGHTRRALRRTVKYGDAWHPTRQTPEFVVEMLPYLRQYAESAERDVSEITISLKRTLHFTDLGLSESDTIRSNGALIATTQEVIEDAVRCQELGIQQLTFDFRTPGVDQCILTMEHFADKVMPVV